jgi:hypothetical protein
MCKIYGLEAVSGGELDLNFRKIRARNIMLSEFLGQILPLKIFLKTHCSLVKILTAKAHNFHF